MKNEILTDRELRRYSRQIMIPEIGISGQEKLKKANILVIGAGGLGCPVLQYLAVAGVGNISIIDFDLVEESNLSRQILYGSSDIGKLKSITAKNRLGTLNPLGNFTVINLKLNSSNAQKILKDFDLVVDATDNLQSRYIISDACEALSSPMVHGSIFRHEGMVSVFNYKGGPTYRSFNPAPADEFLNPAPGNVGFFGVLPGIIGTYMANEVIKIVTGAGEVLSGMILVINIFSNTFSTFKISAGTDKAVLHEPESALVTV